MSKAFNIYCRHCKRKVRPAKYMSMFYCRKCGVPFSASQVKQAKDIDADTLISGEDTVTEPPDPGPKVKKR